MTWIATEQVLRERGLGEQIKDVRYEIEPHDDYKVWVARPSERARVFSIDAARVLVAGGHTAEVIKPFVHEALGKLYPQSQN
jgi:endonuclease YncB( thermonuclease family)